MAKQQKEPSLAGALQAELKRMNPAQVSIFRAELVKKIPAAIQQAAEAARNATGGNNNDNKNGK